MDDYVDDLEDLGDLQDLIDGAVGDRPRGQLANLGEDWDIVLQMLPAGWEAKAVELGAVKHLGNFSSMATLLRVLFIHLADGCSLRETALRASLGGLCEVSDVALLKRLRRCGPWFEWMVREMSQSMTLPAIESSFLAGRRIRLVDGTMVSEPGVSGSTWRLHYALDLRTLACHEVQVTSKSVGESLALFEVRAGDVIMADRGFAKGPGIRHVISHGGDVILRASLYNLPLENPQGQPLDIWAQLREMAIGAVGQWPAQLRSGSAQADAIALRVCVYRKTAAQTLAAREAIEREARKKKRKVLPQTLEAAGYVIVVTTLTDLSAELVMELYRRRWQIELAFKRLKSLLQLGHLKKSDPNGAQAWLQGKLLIACLVEKLILTAERFSPWGYEIAFVHAEETLAVA